MKYIVCGSVAVLASRSAEKISQSYIEVEVVGVPDNAVFYIQKSGGTQKSYSIVSEKTRIPASDISDNGVYQVVVMWQTTEDGQTVSHEAAGNPFKVYDQTSSDKAIIPAPLASATELEKMWEAIAEVLGLIIPFIDSYKNGNDVI